MLRHDPQGGWVEIPPTHCPHGHPLGPHRVLVTWQTDREPHSRALGVQVVRGEGRGPVARAVGFVCG